MGISYQEIQEQYSILIDLYRRVARPYMLSVKGVVGFDPRTARSQGIGLPLDLNEIGSLFEEVEGEQCLEKKAQILKNLEERLKTASGTYLQR